MKLFYQGVCCVLLGINASAHAENVPARAESDSRIKTVMYREYDVIPIHVPVLSTCHITLGEGETIVSIQAGDPLSWQVHQQPSYPNQFFIKPSQIGSNTNLTVITDKRSYYFYLNSHQASHLPIVHLAVKLPKKIVSQTHGLQLNPAHTHCHYRYHGKSIHAPLRVCDDGHITQITLATYQSIPAVFAVTGRDGRETLVNSRLEGRTLTIPEVHPQWTLRAGKQVVSLFNLDYIKALSHE